MMALLWAEKVMAGEKTFAQVPRLLKDRVREILDQHGWVDPVTE